MSYSRPVKAIVVGDTVVGKTSVILNHFHGTPAGASLSTVGVDYQKGDIVVDSQQYQLQVWDTAGQDRFRSISVSYFRRADVILLFFAIDSRDTYNHLTGWADSIDHNKADSSVPVILVGNKADLVERRAVQTAEAEELAARFSWPYRETSALTGEGIKDLFELAVREVIARRAEVPEAIAEPPVVKLEEVQPAQKEKKCC
jgi:small GTP-binding protein